MNIKDIDKFQPVTLNIKDKRTFLQVALLVDSPFFLQDIYNIREQFEINHPFKYGDFHSWGNHLFSIAGFDNDEIEYIRKIQKYENSTENLNEFFNSRKIQKDMLQELKIEFDRLIATTRATFGYPPAFDDLIKQAILFNEIRSDLKAAYPSVIASQDEHGFQKYPEVNVIIFQPYATQEDVTEAYKLWKKSSDDYKAHTKLAPELFFDTPSIIEHTRIWYWQKYKEGEKYDQIIEDWNSKCPKQRLHVENKKCKYCIYDQNIIEQAVSRYRKKIMLLFTSKS